MSETPLDLIIIGGSAAATAAGVYAARRNLKFKIVTKEFGGEIATSGEIGNWPGIVKTDGLSLASDFRAHLDAYHVPIEEGIEVTSITKDSGVFCISTRKHDVKRAADRIVDPKNSLPLCDYQARTVIFATGVHPRELEIPGEKQFRNKGLSYCTVCDGPLFPEKTVVVVGGGNSALESALMLGDIAAKVYVVNKNSSFKGEQILINKVLEKSNIEVVQNAMVSKIIGDGFVTGVEYQINNQTKNIEAEGVFVHVGMVPNSDIVPQNVERDEFRQIKVNTRCETSLPGFFAAGDVTDVPYKQIVIAAAQGCIALLSAVDYLQKST